MIVSGRDYQSDVPHFSPSPAGARDSEIKEGIQASRFTSPEF
jgi:hypothetical protein